MERQRQVGEQSQDTADEGIWVLLSKPDGISLEMAKVSSTWLLYQWTVCQPANLKDNWPRDSF